MGTRWIWNHSGHWYGAYTVHGFCLSEGSAVVVLTNGDYYNVAAPITLALFDYALQYGVAEEKSTLIVGQNLTATIFRGPLQLPEGKKCKVFDITGRVVAPDKIQPGIYFIEIDGVVTQKVVKVR